MRESEASTRERKINNLRLFSSSPTPTPLNWRSINPRVLFFQRALDELSRENRACVNRLALPLLFVIVRCLILY